MKKDVFKRFQDKDQHMQPQTHKHFGYKKYFIV